MPLFDPQINPQQAQSLADLMGGGSAAQYMGMQQAMQQDMNQTNRQLSLADLDKVTLANEHERTMNPMKEQVQRSLVREADSKTPEYFTGMRAGELGTARSQVAKATLDEGTLNSNIAGKNSANQTQMIQDLGKNMLNMVTYVSALPGGSTEQRTAMQQLIRSHGLDKDPASHEIWNKLLYSPDMVGQAKKLAESMMNFNPEHLSKLAVDAQGNASREKIAAGNNAATRYAADARSVAAKKESDAAWKKASPVQKLEWISQLVSQAQENTDPYIELPDGSQMETGRAVQFVSEMQQRIVQQKAAGALVGDTRQRELFNGGVQPPNGNGTGGAVAPARTYDPATKTWK